MSYVRGLTYVWDGGDHVHVWGRNDESMKESIWGKYPENLDGQAAGVTIPYDDWKRLCDAIRAEAPPPTPAGKPREE